MPIIDDSINAILMAYEAAWRTGRPALEEFLPSPIPTPTEASATQRRVVLRELIYIELERRLAAGEAVQCEDYLTRFPELCRESDVVAELVATEFRLRYRMLGIREEDFVRRFPEHHQAIAARLGVSDDTFIGPLRTGTRLGRYLLLEVVGRGTFGIVFRATDEDLQRTVAVKVLRNAAPDTQEIARFLREAQRGANLRHRHLMPVFDAGVDRGVWYLVTEFATGQTLASMIAEGPCPLRRAVELVVAVADALEVVHQAGIIHRDVKPANILLDAEGQPRLSDLGLASLVDQDSARSATLRGTPAYTPPETILGEPPTTLGDVYSLGAVLYELLIGQPPYRGSPTEIARTIATDDPLRPSQLRSEVRRDLDAIVLTALARTPTRRYPSASAFAADLRRWLAGEFILARSPSWLERGQRWAKRNPARASLSLILMGVVSVATAVAYWQWRAVMQERDRAEASFRLAHHAVTHLAQVSTGSMRTDTVADIAEMQPHLVDVIRYYERFVQERANDPTLRRELASAHWALANHALVLHSPASYRIHAQFAWQRYRQVDDLDADESASAIEAALAAAEQASVWAEATAWASSAITRFHQHWPDSTRLAVLAVRLKLAQASSADREAIIASVRTLRANTTQDYRIITQNCLSLGASYTTTDAMTAQRLFAVGRQFADALLANSRDANDHALAAGLEQALGELLYNTLNQRSVARQHFERAHAGWTRLIQSRTPNADQDWSIARTIYHLALMDNSPAARATATTALRRVLTSTRESMRQFGEARAYRERLGSTYHLLGKIGEPATSKERMEWYRLATIERERLSRDEDASDSDRAAFGLSLGRYGVLCLVHDQNTEAVQTLRSAVDIFRSLVDQSPNDSRLDRHLNQCQLDLDRALRRQGR
jgi:tetratricopeptide (TPR) repeat protein